MSSVERKQANVDEEDFDRHIIDAVTSLGDIPVAERVGVLVSGLDENGDDVFYFRFINAQTPEFDVTRYHQLGDLEYARMIITTDIANERLE